MRSTDRMTMLCLRLHIKLFVGRTMNVVSRIIEPFNDEPASKSRAVAAAEFLDTERIRMLPHTHTHTHTHTRRATLRNVTSGHVMYGQEMERAGEQRVTVDLPWSIELCTGVCSCSLIREDVLSSRKTTVSAQCSEDVMWSLVSGIHCTCTSQ